MKEIYLDYAAATPVAKEVLEEMKPYFTEEFGNAGALHSFGQRANGAIDKSREIIANEIGAKFNEIIFTGSATEANNHILRGIIKRSKIEKPQIIISAIEHESILSTSEDLEKGGVDVITIPVSKEGIADINKLKKVLSERTVCVSVIHASNVIGTIQPIIEIADVIKEFREENSSVYPLFHTDTVQAFQFMKIDVRELGVDSLTISSQKIYGPKGVGALYLDKKRTSLVAPFVTGGMQEFGQRSGTENIPGIVGFGRAAELIVKDREGEAERIKNLRDYFWTELQKGVHDISLNGSQENRLPNNLNISFPGKNSQELLIKLDQVGVAVATDSACLMRAGRPSRVITALGIDSYRAINSLRITLGRPTTREEIDIAIRKIVEVAEY